MSKAKRTSKSKKFADIKFGNMTLLAVCSSGPAAVNAIQNAVERHTILVENGTAFTPVPDIFVSFSGDGSPEDLASRKDFITILTQTVPNIFVGFMAVDERRLSEAREHAIDMMNTLRIDPEHQPELVGKIVKVVEDYYVALSQPEPLLLPKAIPKDDKYQPRQGIVDFLENGWPAPYIKAGVLTRLDFRRLDVGGERALTNWMSRNELPSHLQLPTKSDVLKRETAETDQSELLRHAWRVAKRAQRKKGDDENYR